MKMQQRLFGVTLAFAVLLLVGLPVNVALLAAQKEAPTARATQFPAQARPLDVCLTWSDDPRTTQAVQWRTARECLEGWVQYKEKGQDAVSEVEAKRTSLVDRLIQNDPKNFHFTARMKDLKPATAYLYRVGAKSPEVWTDWAEFKTAPDQAVPFSFVYMGDPQVGSDTWGQLLHSAQKNHPNAAFYTLAGDIVNRGNDRNLWDEFFHAADGVFNTHPVVPALGNHDYGKEHDPHLYEQVFDLPRNGPRRAIAGRNYSLRYGNALIVVLDSNRPTRGQANWLEEQLSASDAKWKLAVYHHPMYSSKGNRDNEEVRSFWMPLFDKYHLDMALQGHDHAYLRTYPMKDGQRVETTKDGTVYVVSVSGTKLYDQDQHNYTEVGFTKVSTYQVLDIAVNPDKLTYRAYDADGKVRDELVIQK